MSKELKAWITLGFLSIIWGTSFILIKRSLEVFSPDQVALLRIAISGLGFAPFFFYHFRRLDWPRWHLYIVTAITGSAIPAFLFAFAQTKISSGTAGILNCTTPIFTLIIGVLMFGFATNRKQVIGILIGFIGTAALIYFDSASAASSDSMIYSLLIIAGALCYGFNVNYIKHNFQNVKSILISSFAFTLLSIPALILIPFTDIPQVITSSSEGWMALGYIVALALFSTVLALYFFYQLLQDTSPVFASSVTYLIPIVAMIWGVFDGESIGMAHVICLAVIVGGVYLTREK